jgi:hypothetical protein
MPTSTRTAFRRELKLDSLADLEAELDRVRAAHHAGTLRASGNWTPGQILGHLAKWIGFYYDGFPFAVPGVIRLLCRLFRAKLIAMPIKPGMVVRPKSGNVGDDPAYAFEEGWDRLRAQLDRIRAGESLAGPNPLFGRVTHEEAMRLHLNHAALHLGFLHYEGTPLSGA